jgi:hypothetical protein
MKDSLLSKAWMVLANPTGFFERLSVDEENHTKLKSYRQPILFLASFLIIYCATLPVWIMVNDWILSVSMVPILDFHYGNQVFLAIHKDWFPIFYSYTGNIAISWMVCIPVVYFDTILTAIVFALFIHVLYKHVLGGEGHYGHALAGVCYGDLPSLLFGFIPFSAAIGLLWTGFLQFSATARYLYGLSWNRALVPLILFGFSLVIGWSLFGTVSPPGLLDLIPAGPYGYP